MIFAEVVPGVAESKHLNGRQQASRQQFREQINHKMEFFLTSVSFLHL